MGNATSAAASSASQHGSTASRPAYGKTPLGASATLPNRGRHSTHSPHQGSHHHHHHHHPNCQSTLGGRSRKSRRHGKLGTATDGGPAAAGAESSRVLFLLYLIHRTWNVVVDSVDPKSRRARSTRSTSDDSGAPCSYIDDEEAFDTESAEMDFDDDDDIDERSLYGTQCTLCSCSQCTEQPKRNPIFGRNELRMSFCESELSYSVAYEMAPSASKTPPGTQMGVPKMSAADFAIGGGGGSTHSGSHMSSASVSSTKDNQRPPVYNAEDYIQSLKKYSRRASGSGTIKSIYDTSENAAAAEPATATIEKEKRNAATLPSKHSDYKSPIPTPPANECEMSMRQFGSITDLLTKLRADLRASFPSFVQELVASPMDGVSLLLEVLRAIQLSQCGNATGSQTPTAAAQRNNQSYQRRALLDELACLQCVNLCTTRCPEAALRLGSTPVGLMPLAAAATGQGIRSRILALQLLTAACDRSLMAAAHSAGGSATTGSASNGGRAHQGHNSVSEALSTLRLRCGEPVRFRLLVGMMNSGGGSGELQLHGLKFVNTFLASAENSQNRLYLQAELYQAGFDPMNMANTITESSPWLEKLHAEVRYFEEHKIDVEKLLVQNREAERIRSQMVILERRVQILHEEKTVLTSMERRLQERCADLQREVYRLQGANHQDSYKNLDKRPVALPRHVPPPFAAHQSNATTSANPSAPTTTATGAKLHSGGGGRPSEQDDEGISSSETGQSMSPEPPCLVLPMGNSQKYRITVTSEDTATASSGGGRKIAHHVHDDDDAAVTIDEVIEELANIVSDAEREIRVGNKAGGQQLHQQRSATTGEPAVRSSLTEGGSTSASRMEQDIVPVNLLPQPPRKSRSLVHLLSQRGSEDFDGGSEYGILMGGVGGGGGHHHNGVGLTAMGDVGQQRSASSFFDDLHYDHEHQKFGRTTGGGGGSATALDEPLMLGGGPDVVNQSSTNREILNVIMDAREKDGGGGMDGLMMMHHHAGEHQLQQQQQQQHEATATTNTPASAAVPAHKFSGVFFMAEMNTPQKYPKPDITAALEARRVTKNLDRMESYGSGGIDSMIDIVMTETAQKQALKQQQQQMLGATAQASILLTGAKQSRFTGGSGTTATVTSMASKPTNGRLSASGSRLTDLPSGLY